MSLSMEMQSSAGSNEQKKGDLNGAMPFNKLHVVELIYLFVYLIPVLIGL